MMALLFGTTENNTVATYRCSLVLPEGEVCIARVHVR